MKKIFSSPYSIVAAGVLFILCTYWIYKNVRFEDLIGKSNITNVSDTPMETSSRNFEIRLNDVVEIISLTETKVVIKGDRIEDMMELSDLGVSPNGENLCFLVRTIVPVWLYLSDSSGENLAKVDLAKNCVWSPGSRYIAYNNHTTDVSPVDIKIYDITTGDIKNLTGDVAEPGYIRNYSTPTWDNEGVVRASYLEFKETDVSVQEEGITIIDVVTGEELSLF